MHLTAGGDMLGNPAQVPVKYLCWAELVVASLINPNSSFLGHLTGIAAGFIHVKVKHTHVHRCLPPIIPPCTRKLACERYDPQTDLSVLIIFFIMC